MKILTRIWLAWVIVVACVCLGFGALSWEFMLTVFFTLPGSAWCAWYWGRRPRG